MTNELTVNDLRELGGEARIHDLRLAEILEYGESRGIRHLIRRHKAKLLKYGVLVTSSQTHGPKGGRPATEYHLNEGQAIRIVTLSETKKADDATKQIIDTFIAYRKGTALPPPVEEDPETQFARAVLTAQKLLAEKDKTIEYQKEVIEKDIEVIQKQNETIEEKDVEIRGYIDVIIDQGIVIRCYTPSEGSMTISDVARMTTVGQAKAFAILKGEKYIFKKRNSDIWYAYADRREQGILEICSQPYTDQRTGEECYRPQTRVTKEGIDKIVLVLEKNKYLYNNNGKISDKNPPNAKSPHNGQQYSGPTLL